VPGWVAGGCCGELAAALGGKPQATSAAAMNASVINRWCAVCVRIQDATYVKKAQTHFRATGCRKAKHAHAMAQGTRTMHDAAQGMLAPCDLPSRHAPNRLPAVVSQAAAAWERTWAHSSATLVNTKGPQLGLRRPTRATDWAPGGRGADAGFGG